jgi:hypothetical protein
MIRFALAFMASAVAVVPVTAAAQSSQETRFVQAVLNQLQQRSFDGNREYCGFIGIDANGRYASGPVSRGDRDSCEPRWPDNLDVIASFHTHGGYDPGAWSEVPSVNDMEADEEDGVDGWVATPGGRLWYIDTQDMVTSQICGVGCLMQDPRWQPETEVRIRQSYTYRELIRFEATTD